MVAAAVRAKARGLAGVEGHSAPDPASAVARAVAKRPDVLLCDEPTGALDSVTGIRVLEALASVNRQLGTTTLVITHNASIAVMAHRVVRFADGRIASVEVNADRRPASEVRW